MMEAALARHAAEGPSVSFNRVDPYRTPPNRGHLALHPEDAQNSYNTSSPSNNILHTPRRGRRMAGVDIWGTPPPSMAPTTVPRLEKRPSNTERQQNPSLGRGRSESMGDAKFHNNHVTPRKRRNGHLSSDENAPTLVDIGGWAAAGLNGYKAGPSAREAAALGIISPPTSLMSADEPHTAMQSSQTPRFDHLLLFGDGLASASPSKIPKVEQKPALVAVEVPGRGRLIVSPLVAPQMQGTPSMAGGNSTPTSSKRRPTQTPSSQSTGLRSAPSPSFSLASHFPASSFGGSPAALTAEAEAPTQTPSREMSLPKLGQGLGPGIDAQLPGTSEGSTHNTPQLCCDSLGRDEKDSRIGGIARWLERRDDEATSSAPESKTLSDVVLANAFYADGERKREEILRVQDQHQHPMVAKALRDRARREAMARSYSMPDMRAKPQGIVSPRRRSRKADSGSKHSQGRSSRSRKKLEKKLAQAAAAKAELTAIAHSTAKDARQKGSRSKDALRAGTRGAHDSVLLTPNARTTDALLLAASPSIIGCSCGHAETLGAMVRCDACHSWYHLYCLGIASEDDLDEEWYCDGCCEGYLHNASPGDLDDVSTGFSFGDSANSTPLEGLLQQLSQEAQASGRSQQEPVFAHPTESPAALRSTRFDALALAPSPRLASYHTRGEREQSFAATLGASTAVDSSTGTATTFAPAVRTRAARFGSYYVEPASPLDRKSFDPRSDAPASPSPNRRRIATFALDDPFGTPNLMLPRDSWSTHEHADDTWHVHASSDETTKSQAVNEAGRERPARTPSPAVSTSAFATPSRHAKTSRLHGSSGGSSGSRARYGTSHSRPVEGDYNPDDPFSTPSRLMMGGSSPWSQQSTSGAGASLASPSQRRNSHAPWLGTPTTGLLGTAFGGHKHPSSAVHTHDDSDYGVGLPSLPFSTSVGERLQDAGSHQEHHSWLLPSPSTSTSGARFGPSSVLHTPELLSQRSRGTNVSSVRRSARRSSGQRDEDELPSSSPLPRTPTHDEYSLSVTATGSPRMRGAFATPSSSKRLASLTSSSTNDPLERQVAPSSMTNGTKGQSAQPHTTGPAQHASKARVASGSELAGLGIDMDFEDILDISQ
ncbi:CPG BINDING PROTEIN [Ceraceosorus bombacis]|uniref:CPG BINDING PROTEIN n=1 Tax=Ceraceosorus bombacis TaxID=401625 RepID=A0A0P1BIN5_9BASI|nr:CPG BINDING PROTEIN [Ceraceosorus bombacis]